MVEGEYWTPFAFLERRLRYKKMVEKPTLFIDRDFIKRVLTRSLACQEPEHICDKETGERVKNPLYDKKRVDEIRTALEINEKKIQEGKQ